jgi:hypothetical protein
VTDVDRHRQDVIRRPARRAQLPGPKRAPREGFPRSPTVPIGLGVTPRNHSERACACLPKLIVLCPDVPPYSRHAVASRGPRKRVQH